MTAWEREYEEQQDELHGQLEQAIAGTEVALRHLSNLIEEMQKTVDSGALHLVMENILNSYIMDFQQQESSLSVQVDHWKQQAKDIEEGQQQRAEERRAG